jgi:outer membrane protein OmpA-like peptidoglycan-associated protein
MRKEKKGGYMMKKYVLLLAIASLAFAMPNYEGTMGLFRTISADNGSAGTFQLGLYLRGFTEERLADPTGDSLGNSLAGTNATYGGGDFGFNLGYAPSDWLSFNVSGVYYGDGIDYDDTDTNRASVGFGDTKVGLKLNFGGADIKYGLYTWLSFPTGSDRDLSAVGLTRENYPIFNDAYTNPGGLFRYFSSDAIDVGGMVLFTAKTGVLQFDLNLGHLFRNANSGGTETNATIYNVALSLQTAGVIPFVELSGIDYGHGSFWTAEGDSIWGSNPVYFTPGISFRPSKNWNINFAVDIRAWEGENTHPFPTPQTDSFNITTGWGATPPWAGIFGISYTADFMPEPVIGQIAGTVLDDQSGEYLAANVSVYQQGVLVTSMDSDDNGQFAFMQLDPGAYKLTAKAIDYRPYDVDLFVKAGETTPVTAPLTPIPKEGNLILTIFDIESKEQLSAEVTVDPLPAEKVMGRFEKTLGPGAHRLAVMAEDKNYLPYERVINIEAAKTLEIEVALVKKEFKIVLPEVYFEFAKSDIKPESYGVLDGAAKTIKTVFAGNPDVKIEVQGHTDSVGSDKYNLNLSNERAGSVKEYLVINQGIDPNRLLARGYGESKPVGSNKSESGRQRNRRVEFVVMQ